VAAVWTLIKLIAPIAAGLVSAMAASRVRREGHGAALDRTEQDMPLGLVGLVSLACLVPIGSLLVQFAHEGGLDAMTAPLLLGGLVYVVLIGFMVSAVCGYMAGLVGSSNSPVSGVGILAVVVAALLLLALTGGAVRPSDTAPLVAFALFATSAVFSAAIVSNDNLQDLKTGQLVDSTPWKQQAALIVGVVIGAAVIPPILDLLNKAYGFTGAPGANPLHALPAPQAVLISSLAKGVLRGDLDWGMIGIGVVVGVALVVLNEVLTAARRPGIAPLAVALGLYLPMSSSVLIVVGAFAGSAFDKRAASLPHGDVVKRLGVLLASGLIVGESLVGILVAGLVVFSGKDTPLAIVGDAFQPFATVLTLLAFAGVVLGLYRWTSRLVRR
jgi:putative OPT family oligopeptide transporter